MVAESGAVAVAAADLDAAEEAGSAVAPAGEASEAVA